MILRHPADFHAHFKRAALLAGLAWLGTACGGDASPVAEPSEPADTPEWIAEWRRVRLPASEFQRQYIRLASTAPMPDSRELRNRTAYELLERRILADHARRLSFDTLASVRRRVIQSTEPQLAAAFIREQALRKQPPIREQDIRDAFRRRHTRMDLHQIYAPDRDGIDVFNERLRAGESFESLASESMRAAGEPADSWKMGWVEWNQLGLDAEIAAFALQPGQISQPVRSAAGWHIFRADNRQETFFADAATYADSRESLRSAIERRRVQQTGGALADSILRETELMLDLAVLREVWTELALLLAGSASGPSPGPASGGAPEPPALLRALATDPERFGLPPAVPLDTPVATLDGRPFTVQDLLVRLPNVPSDLVIRQPRRAVELALGDWHLSRLAVESGLDRDPERVLDAELARTSALVQALLSRTLDTLRAEHHMQAFHNANRERFVDGLSIRYRAAVFADSAEAVRARAQALALARRSSASERADYSSQEPADFPTLEPRTAVRSESPDGPVVNGIRPPESASDPQSVLRDRFRLLAGSAGDRMWIGPFPEGRQWALYQATDIDTVYRELPEAREEALSLLDASRPAYASQHLLRSLGYSRADVRLRHDRLEVIPVPLPR